MNAAIVASVADAWSTGKTFELGPGPRSVGTAIGQIAAIITDAPKRMVAARVRRGRDQTTAVSAAPTHCPAMATASGNLSV